MSDDLFSTGAAPRFDDGKEPDALRTIGEVAQALGLRQHVLRYWEEQFPMLKPLKRSGGRRYYRPEDVVLVETIDRLVHREGYTLRGAKKALQAGASRGASGGPLPAVPAGAGEAASDALRGRLLTLRAILADALQQA